MKEGLVADAQIRLALRVVNPVDFVRRQSAVENHDFVDQAAEIEIVIAIIPADKQIPANRLAGLFQEGRCELLLAVNIYSALARFLAEDNRKMTPLIIGDGAETFANKS
jgi:hypothetical protein